MAKLTSTDIYGSLNVQGITNLGDSLTGSSATFFNANIGLANINTMNLSNLNIGEAEDVTWSIDASNPASFFIRDKDDGIRFAITNEGKVGIGTSTPGQILSVNGNIEGSKIISDFILGTGAGQTKELFNNSDFLTLEIGTQMGTDSDVYLGSNLTTVHIPGSLVVDGNMTVNSVEMVSTSNGIVFEGPTIDDYETTLNAIDPTANRNILLPNASGTVLMTNDVKTAGYFYGGTTSPTNVNRLNYDGYIYATKVFSGGSEVYTTSNLPTYPTSFNLTDDILDGSANKYMPYATQQAKLSFDKSTTAPSRTDRLNLNGYLYATKLYSGGTEVLTKHPAVSAASSVNNSGRTYIQDITLDSFGHVTGLTTATETVVNTNTTYSQSWVDSGTNAILRLSAGGSGSGNDDLTLVAGSNITLTPSGDNLTIAATNTNTIPNNGTLTMSTSGIGLSGSASFTADQSGPSTFKVTSNATSSNTASTIVARDASGNFSAETITANLTGTASGNLTPESELNPAKVSQTASYRFVTDSEKTTWNSKQDALGYTPENVANKRTSIRASGATDTSYVSELGVKTYVDGLIGSVYRPSGDWNADTNSPTLANNTPANAGKVYRVSVAGTRFDFDFAVGDKLAFNESGVISKWDNVDDVVSVNGQIGTVELTTDDIDQGSNLYVLQSEKNTWDGKQSLITGAATTITSSNLTTNRALVSSGSGKVAVSAVTSTELGYLDGVTSSIQTQLDGKSGRAILTGQLQTTSYRRSVIALCELTNTNPSANSYSVGTLTFHRMNGLSSAVKYDFAIEKRYNVEGFNLSQTVLANSSFVGGIRPCIFVKNGIKYGGIEVYFSDAELRDIEFHGTTNFEIFGLDYYITNTSTPLDTEVNNSLVFDDSTNIRLADTFKVGNGLMASQPWVTTNTRSNTWTPTWGQVSDKPSVIIEGDSRLTDARPASDVNDWAKADLNEMAYFDYAGSIYGDKYSLLENAWEHSLTVIPSEISAISSYLSPRGTAQYLSGETEGVIIPNIVTSIGAYAFHNWSSNNQPLVIPNSVTSIGAAAFLDWTSNNQPLVIPNSVTSIGDYAFRDWTSNNHPLVIPNSVTSITIYAFAGWESNNQPLVIPNSVKYIGSSAFNGWSSNNQPLVIPSSVEEIGGAAFYGWSSVPYIEILRITPPTLANINAFSNQNDAPIYVPDERVDNYKTATNWIPLADRIFPISDKVGVQADWNETNSNSNAFIKNKPTIPEPTAVINNLTSTSTTSALSANQGKVLQDNKVDKTSIVDNVTTDDATKVLSAKQGKRLKDDLDTKVDSVAGKGLSTEDYTTTEKNRLAGIEEGAEVNVQSDWNVTNSSSDAFIKNKPTIPEPTAVINNLTSTSTTSALSANQGRILSVNLNALSSNFNGFATYADESILDLYNRLGQTISYDYKKVLTQPTHLNGIPNGEYTLQRISVGGVGVISGSKYITQTINPVKIENGNLLLYNVDTALWDRVNFTEGTIDSVELFGTWIMYQISGGN